MYFGFIYLHYVLKHNLCEGFDRHEAKSTSYFLTPIGTLLEFDFLLVTLISLLGSEHKTSVGGALINNFVTKT
jgi:hypothetical protein